MQENIRFAAAICCIDGRIQKTVRQFIKEKYQVDFVDMINKAGVDGILAENVRKSVIESIKEDTLISTNGHMTRYIAIVGHYDCAANPVDIDTHKQQILESLKLIFSWDLNCRIIGLFINKEWKVEVVKEIDPMIKIDVFLKIES